MSLGQASSVAAYYRGTAVGTSMTVSCKDCGRMLLVFMGPRCWGCDRKLLG